MKFKDRKELMEHVEELFKNAISEGKKKVSFYEETSYKTIERFKKILDEKDVEGLIKLLVDTKELGYYYYINNLFSLNNVSFFGFPDRCIWKVGDEQVSLFDLFGFTDNDMDKIANAESCGNNLVFIKLVYIHLINKKYFDLAEMILAQTFEKYIEGVRRYDNGPYTFLIASDYSADYIPLLNYCAKNEKTKVSNELMVAYTESLYKQTPLDNSFDRTNYIKFYKLFKKEMKNVLSSAIFKEGPHFVEKRDTTPLITNFDLIESDAGVKEKLFRLDDYNFIKMFNELYCENPERLLDLMYDYLNTEHYKGKKKRKFLYTYKGLKSELGDLKYEIDPFKLNPMLQSYILLEILN